MRRVGDGLAGWAYRIRTAESGGELPDWICATTWLEAGASPAAETFHVLACMIPNCKRGPLFQAGLQAKRVDRNPTIEFRIRRGA